MIGFFEGISLRAKQWPAALRVILAAWIAAGVIYVVANPSPDVVPLPIAIVTVAPFLIVVLVLMAWNALKLVRWATGSNNEGRKNG